VETGFTRVIAVSGPDRAFRYAIIADARWLARKYCEDDRALDSLLTRKEY
jgi:hypothetical protein